MRAPSLADPLPDGLVDEARARGGAVVDEARARGGVVLEEAAIRSGAAWDALRGERVGPPVAVRRWPWAIAAAAAGAAAGVLVAVAVRRLSRPDPPGALDPEDVQAVIDRP